MLTPMLFANPDTLLCESRVLPQREFPLPKHSVMKLCVRQNLNYNLLIHEAWLVASCIIGIQELQQERE